MKPLPKRCGGKVIHSSEGDAWGSAARIVGRNTPRLRVYQCRDCEGWHLTKQRQRS